MEIIKRHRDDKTRIGKINFLKRYKGRSIVQTCLWHKGISIVQIV